MTAPRRDMEGTVPRSLAVLLASAAGVAVYIGVFHLHRSWLLIVLAVAAAVGLLGLVVGHLLMRRHPVPAVWLIGLVPIASLAIAILVTFGAARAGVVVRQHLEHLPKAENDTLTEAIGAVIAGVAGLLVLHMLADRASWLWPRRHVEAAFGRCFNRRWRSGTAVADAILADYVPRATPVIRGWGWNARRHRASVIRAALAGDGTPAFAPVPGPALTQPTADPDATTPPTSSSGT